MKKLLKIFACMLLTLAMCVSLVACGGNGEDETGGPGFVSKVTLAAKLKVLSNKVDKMTTMEGLLAFEAAIDEVLASYDVVGTEDATDVETESVEDTTTVETPVETDNNAPVNSNTVENTPVETEVPVTGSTEADNEDVAEGSSTEVTPVETEEEVVVPEETEATVGTPVETTEVTEVPVSETTEASVNTETTEVATTVTTEANTTEALVTETTESATTVEVPVETTEAPVDTTTETSALTPLTEVVEDTHSTDTEADPLVEMKNVLKAKVDMVKTSEDSDYLGDVIASIIVLEKVEDAALRATLFKVVIEFNTEDSFAEFVTYVETLIAEEVANVKDYVAPEYKWEKDYHVGYRIDYCIKRVLTFKTTKSTESVINCFGTPSVEPEVEVSTEL